MAANSSHYGDVNMWIKKVIDSCESHDQLESAKKLINNFANLYYGQTNGQIRRSLIILCFDKQKSLQKIMKTNG